MFINFTMRIIPNIRCHCAKYASEPRDDANFQVESLSHFCLTQVNLGRFTLDNCAGSCISLVHVGVMVPYA